MQLLLDREGACALQRFFRALSHPLVTITFPMQRPWCAKCCAKFQLSLNKPQSGELCPHVQAVVAPQQKLLSSLPLGLVLSLLLPCNSAKCCRTEFLCNTRCHFGPTSSPAAADDTHGRSPLLAEQVAPEGSLPAQAKHSNNCE